jgi:uncharacterized protein (DUF885 family)
MSAMCKAARMILGFENSPGCFSSHHLLWKNLLCKTTLLFLRNAPRVNAALFQYLHDTMNRFLPFFTLLAIFIFPTAIAQLPPNNAAFSTFLEQYYQQNAAFNPLTLTSRGDNRLNDQLPNAISVKFLEDLHDFNIQSQKQLSAFNRESLSSFDRISYDIVNTQLRRALQAEQFHLEYIPFDQWNGLPVTFPSLGSGNSYQPFATVKDYYNWLKRIEGFTVYIDTAMANFDKGIARGMVLPKSLVVKLIPQLLAQTETDTTKNLFYKPILNMPATFSREEKRALRAAYKKAIASQIVPTYAKLAAYMQETYLPKARLTAGYNDLPNGEALYQFIVAGYATTDQSPEVIRQLGLDEVARITREIEKLKDKIGFAGSIDDLFNYSLTAKEFFPFTTVEEILDAYQSILPKIAPNLEKLFNLVPRTAFEVRAIEKFKAASSSANYQRAAADGSRPGYFNVPVLDPLQYNKLGMENLFLHEAIPGHHYQLSLQQENQALPKIRQFASIHVFSEGWALYVESLGKELGLYTDPYQELAAYKAEIFRATRLVVDTSLHTGKMTREEAIAYMIKYTGREEKSIISEVERYLAMPGQALTYKIGELKMKELKTKYQQELGNRFDIKKFHDAVLQIGSVPLYAFESYLEQWAKEQNR